MNSYILKEKIRFKDRKEYYYYLLLMVIAIVAYYSFFINRYFPDTVGWQSFSYKLMQNGKMVYRDFFYYLPPMELVFSNVRLAIAGDSFLALRIIGLIERVAMFILLYNIFTRYFKPQYVCLSCIVAATLMSVSPHDLPGDYNQTYIFLMIGIIYFFIKFFESEGNNRKENLWLFCSGILLGTLFLYKQSIGVIAPIAFLIAMIVICVIQKSKQIGRYIGICILGFVVPVGICMIWLLANNAFWPFLEQVYLKATSKGGIGNVFGGALNALVNEKYLFIFCVIAALLFLGRIYQKRKKNIRNKDLIKGGMIAAGGLAIILFLLNYYDLSIAFFNAILHSGYIYCCALLILAGVIYYVYQCFLKQHIGLENNSRHEDIFVFAVIIGLILYSYLLLRFLPIENIEILLAESGFYAACAAIPYYGFYTAVAVTVICILYFVFKKRPYHSYSIMILAFGIMICTVESAMTSTTTIGIRMVSITLPLMLGLLLSYEMPGRRLKNVLVVVLCIITCSLCLAQRLVHPYDWWGWTDEPISNETNYEVNVPGLEGFKVSKQSKEVYETVTKLIEENSDENDFVWGFPHIKIFNLLTDRMAQPTFVPVYFFDVCPDNYAIDDLKILKENKPDIVIWCDIGEDGWTTHERVFREGNRSGQRDIREWFEGIRETDYIEIGNIYNLTIYKLKDDPNTLNVTNESEKINVAEGYWTKEANLLLTSSYITEECAADENPEAFLGSVILDKQEIKHYDNLKAISNSTPVQWQEIEWTNDMVQKVGMEKSKGSIEGKYSMSVPTDGYATLSVPIPDEMQGENKLVLVECNIWCSKDSEIVNKNKTQSISLKQGWNKCTITSFENPNDPFLLGFYEGDYIIKDYRVYANQGDANFITDPNYFNELKIVVDNSAILATDLAKTDVFSISVNGKSVDIIDVNNGDAGIYLEPGEYYISVIPMSVGVSMVSVIVTLLIIAGEFIWLYVLKKRGKKI